MAGNKHKNNATMVISPNTHKVTVRPPGQGQSKKAKARRRANMSSMPDFSTNGGVRNSFVSDNSGNSLDSKMRGSMISNLIGESSGSSRDSIYRGVNYAGVSSAGIRGQSGNMYLDCLVDPSRGPVRIPDDYDKPTAIHQEILYFTVASGASGGTTANSSAIIVNPFAGIAVPTTYRNGTVTVNVGNGAGGYVPTYYADPDIASLTAICNNIRPTSCSIYVTYIGDTLTDGGQIAAAEIAGNGVTGVGLSPTGQDLSSVAALALQPMAYSGPLRKGSYVYWTPEDSADSFFYSFSQAAAYNYPVLIVAFKSTQAATTVVRCTVVVNYEYTTSSRLVTSLPSPICPQLITGAKQVLQSQPRAVANDEHGDWWTRVLDGARGFFSTIGNGIYSLFHPAMTLVSQAGSDAGLGNAAEKFAAFRGASALSSVL
jgi:hypothetical protein